MIQLHLFPAHLSLPTPALIDSGCSGHAFIDCEFIQHHQIETYPSPQPRELRLADGIASDQITDYTIIPMSISGHNEHCLFFVTQLAPSTPAILGLPWLKKHNPSVDWTTMQLTFDSWRCMGQCNVYGNAITATTILDRPKKTTPRLSRAKTFKPGLYTITEKEEEDDQHHRTCNYQDPAVEEEEEEGPAPPPQKSNYQTPLVEDSTEEDLTPPATGEEMYVHQTLKPGCPHYQTYNRNATNGGPEVRVCMIPNQNLTPHPIHKTAGQRQKAKRPQKGALLPLSMPIPSSCQIVRCEVLFGIKPSAYQESVCLCRCPSLWNTT
jgi:hypothetical protein